MNQVQWVHSWDIYEDLWRFGSTQKKKKKKKEVDSASRLLSILVKQFCTSLFITILGCLVEIKSMQDVDDGRMWIGIV